MIKKFMSILLLGALGILWFAPGGTAAKPGSLYEFVKTTENISASFTYPSMKLASSTSGKHLLNARTPIIIRSNSPINSNNIASGDSVIFSVAQDVKDSSGNIIIKNGTPVNATIDFQKAGNIGKSGKITITDFHTTAVDGTYVPLSSSVSVAPEDKMVLSVVLSVCICPLFLLMDGEQAQLPAGTTKTVYTMTDVYVNANSL